MTAALRPRYTFVEYIQLERVSREVKHEYVAGEIFAMAGGTVEHAALATALIGLMFNHLRGGPYRAYGSDLQLRIRAAEVATYADVVVVCDPVERDPESTTHVTKPRVVVQVLSPTTERDESEQKRLNKQQLDSL
ncbi:MAG: Uma2 family endonuclease, partial [Nannocystaceae bacterium]